MVHVSFLRLKMSIHLARKAQLALLLTEKVTMPVEYLDFANVFLEKSVNIFLERTKANKHGIDLEEGEQPLYRPIYSLGPVELEIFKTHIKTNPANGFIQILKSPADASILFGCKPDGSLCLYINY